MILHYSGKGRAIKRPVTIQWWPVMHQCDKDRDTILALRQSFVPAIRA